jgi:uncharacterized membrane protein YeaQ/YmgE (transglycosylase-associated protein family)
MVFVLWLVEGLVAGVLAMLAVFRKFPRTAFGWAGALLAGLVGGWVGGFVTDLIGLTAVNWLGALVIAFLGAYAVLLLLRRMLPIQA